MATRAEVNLDATVRAYLRERVTIAGSENTEHAKDCVRTFVEAAMIDELHKLIGRVIEAEAKFLESGK
jgi:hypothetical protein